ncbi:hypothetical protein DFS33DRAFT_761975 [Desarmillaria ectypa]|nr:hypothetical protein DFS33DRAFT_761975 [Desarmillaria ectypa]
MPPKPPPIHRLPAELLSEIFHSHSSYLGNGTLYDVAVVRGVPWLLTHICHHWKETAMMLTSLWSSFIIKSQLADTKDPEALLQIVLKRSGRSPLSFRMPLSALLSMELPIPKIISLLAVHSTAWKDIQFVMSSNEYYNKVMSVFSDSPVPVQLSLLEALHIIIVRMLPEDTSEDTRENSDASELDQHSITATFANAHMLHSVIMEPLLPISLPWPQITYLRTSELSLEQLFDLFM